MKATLIILTLFISAVSFAQTLEFKKIDKADYSFFDSYTFENVYALEKNLKTTAPYKNFDFMGSERLVFTPQNFNTNTSFPDFSKYFLKDELRKVMLEIPGLHRPINHKPF